MKNQLNVKLIIKRKHAKMIVVAKFANIYIKKCHTSSMIFNINQRANANGLIIRRNGKNVYYKKFVQTVKKLVGYRDKAVLAKQNMSERIVIEITRKQPTYS